MDTEPKGSVPEDSDEDFFGGSGASPLHGSRGFYPAREVFGLFVEMRSLSSTTVSVPRSSSGVYPARNVLSCPGYSSPGPSVGVSTRGSLWGRPLDVPGVNRQGPLRQVLRRTQVSRSRRTSTPTTPTVVTQGGPDSRACPVLAEGPGVTGNAGGSGRSGTRTRWSGAGGGRDVLRVTPKSRDLSSALKRLVFVHHIPGKRVGVQILVN